MVLLLVAACQPTPAPGKPAEPVVAAAPTTPASPSVAPRAPVAPSVAIDAAAAPLPPRVSDPASFACGGARCKVGSESCCWFSDEGACVPSAPPGANDTTQVLASQIEACDKLKAPFSLSEIRRCDESSDCARGEACCGMFLYGGASADFCVPIKNPKRAPCDFSEVCTTDDTCRVPGAKCIDGACKKPAIISCNGQPCAGKDKACCGDPPACRAASDCTTPHFACTSPKDCLTGEHCRLQVGGSLCTNFEDVANARMICDKTSDCGGPNPFCQRYACKPSEHAGIKACECL